MARLRSTSAALALGLSLGCGGSTAPVEQAPPGLVRAGAPDAGEPVAAAPVDAGAPSIQVARGPAVRGVPSSVDPWFFERVSSMAFLEGGRLLVTATETAVGVWDVQTRVPRFRYPIPQHEHDLVLFPASRGALLAGIPSSYNPAGRVYVWSARDGAGRPGVFELGPSLGPVAVSQEGNVLAAGVGANVVVVDLERRVRRASIATGRVPIYTIDVSRDGSTIAARHLDDSVTLVDGRTGARRAPIALPPSRSLKIVGVAIAPDGRTVLVERAEIGQALVVHVFRLDRGGQRRDVHLDADSLSTSMAPPILFSPDGSRFAAVGKNVTSFVDTATLAVTRALGGATVGARFAGSSDRLVTFGDGANLVVANGPGSRMLFPKRDRPTGVYAVSPDGRSVAAWDGEAVALVDVESGRRLGDIRNRDWVENIGAAGATDDGGLAWASGRTHIHSLDPGGGFRSTIQDANSTLLLRPGKPGAASQFSSDRFDLLDLRAGSSRGVASSTGWLEPLGYSPTGDLLAVREQDRVDLHDASTGALRASIAADVRHSGMRVTSGWSPSGSLLALSTGTSITVWDAQRGRIAAEIRNATRSSLVPGELLVSPDESALLAVAGADASLWDLRTGARRQAYEKSLRGAAFLPGSADFMVPSSGGLRFHDGRTGLQKGRLARRGWCNGTSAVGPSAFAASCEGTIEIGANATSPTRSIRTEAGSYGLRISRDGRLVAALGSDAVELWDARSGARVARADLVIPNGTAFAMSPRGDLVLAGTYYGLRIVRASDGAVLTIRTRSPDPRGETRWIAYLQNGLFEGDLELAARIGVRVGEDAMSSPMFWLDQLAEKLRRPGLLSAFLTGAKIEAPGELVIETIEEHRED